MSAPPSALHGAQRPGAPSGARRAATTPLGRELRYTLTHAQNYLVRLPRAEPDPILLLRAARASWLVDELDAMCVYYREASVQLLEVVDLSGRRTGTSAEYWRLALGALWMASSFSDEGKERTADQATLRSTAYKIVDIAQRMAFEAGQPLDRISLELIRVRASWYAGDVEFPRLLSALDQRIGAMDVNSRGLWMGERDQLAFAALKSITVERPERMVAPLAALDEHLAQDAVRPPTIMDLVDEEVLALEAAATKKGARLDRLRLAPKRGTRRSETGAR